MSSTKTQATETDEFFFAHVEPVVRCSFTVAHHQDAAGRTRETTHVFRRPSTDREHQELFGRYEKARAGKKGEERERAGKQAIFSVWRELIRSVEGYGDRVDAMEPSELARYFSGADLPDSLGQDRLAEIKDAMATHVVMAIVELGGKLSLAPSFRG